MGENYPALRYTNNMWENCKNGVWTVECNSWKEFKDRIEKFKKAKYKYIWRGQSSEARLLPTIYRDDKPDEIKIEDHLSKFKKHMPRADALEEFLERVKKEKTKGFEKALSEYYNMIHPKADDNDPKENYIKDLINDIYWAIGQHHGLKTPLLDWTLDPYKALFFAFCGRKGDDGKRVVYGLAEKSRLLLEKRQQAKRYIELLTNLDFIQTILVSSESLSIYQESISSMFKRIKAQNGVFTHSLHIEDAEKHAKRCYDFYKKHRNDEVVFLIKILIPKEKRESVLENLEEKKITYNTMFPDFHGAALHCNLKLEQCGG